MVISDSSTRSSELRITNTESRLTINSALPPQNLTFAIPPHRNHLGIVGAWIVFEETMAVLVGDWLTIFVQHRCGERENHGMGRGGRFKTGGGRN